jgi:hypothetical protein
MKRVLLCGLVACVVGLLLAPAALASTRSHHRGSERVRRVPAAARPYAGLGAGQTYAISGVVHDFAGARVPGAEVDWSSANGGPSDSGNNLPGYTGADGAFSFPTVTSTPGLDDLTVFYPKWVYDQAADAGLWKMESWTLDFSTTGSYDLRPAHVNLHVANAPSPAIEVVAGNATVGYAQTDVTLNGSHDGVASVLPMTGFDSVVGFYYTDLFSTYSVCRSQVESLSTPAGLAGGGTAADTVDLDWSAPHRAALAGPQCRHSGKPGTAVTMALSGWPAGEQAAFIAFYGTSSTHGYTANPTSTGVPLNVPLSVLPSAPVGVYEIDTYRTGLSGTPGADSLVDMWDLFQVCTFKPSASSIRHGGAVRLSGKVPGTGNVTIYSATHKVSKAPATLAAKGWHRIGAYKISSRRFASGLLHPQRTTWYVARYKGYAFQAFTSVVKVAVR